MALVDDGRAAPDLPDLPPDVAAALAEVSIVDRGVGFDPDAVPAGVGLSTSTRDRMGGAGGAVEESSTPGEGTRVDLTWPA